MKFMMVKVLARLQRWSIFDSDAMPLFFFITAMRCRWFLDILNIAIGAENGKYDDLDDDHGDKNDNNDDDLTAFRDIHAFCSPSA